MPHRSNQVTSKSSHVVVEKEAPSLPFPKATWEGGLGWGPAGGSGASSGPRRLFNRSRAVQQPFLPPKKASRSLPRCFRRASGGFMCSGRAPRPYFGSIYGFQEDAAAPQESKNFVRRPSDFEVVRFSFRVAIRVRCRTLAGSIMRTIWPL